MKETLSLIVTCLLMSVVTLQADTRSGIYNAFLNKDMNAWKTIMTNLEHVQPKTLPQVLELVDYQYGYIGWCLGVGRKSEAKQWLEKGGALLALMEQHAYQPTSVSAYKAAFVGFRLQLTPLKAPVLGPRVQEWIDLALKQDKENPFAYLQMGNGLYYRSKVFGGSKEKAMTYYHQAEQLLEKTGNTRDWKYLHLLAQIGVGYLELGRSDKAEASFRKALRVEPRFTWVKEEWYPILKQTTGK